jgi:hypothetical protein
MKTLSFTSLFFAALPFAAIACSSGDFAVGSDQSGATGDPSVDGGACVTDTDCGNEEHCGFKNTDACAATGRCFASSGVQCAAYSAGCACDGTEINVACTPYPTGYSSKPLLHDGACTGGSAQDAGTGGPCNADSDCPGTNQACAYLESEACAAHGTCVAVNTGPECAAYSAGCACDGTEINVACLPYPAGYDSKPLAHTGACGTETDGGSGAADAGK